MHVLQYWSGCLLSFFLLNLFLFISFAWKEKIVGILFTYYIRPFGHWSICYSSLIMLDQWALILYRPSTVFWFTILTDVVSGSESYSRHVDRVQRLNREKLLSAYWFVLFGCWHRRCGNLQGFMMTYKLMQAWLIAFHQLNTSSAFSFWCTLGL
jgi:hypothetical protein